MRDMRLLLALLMCAALGSVAQAAGRATTVTGEGHAVIAGDRGQAYAQAKQQALHDAVAQVVRSLGGPAEGEDEALDRALYARAATFCLRATVLDDDVDGTILNLRSSVVVDADAVARALGGRRGSSKATGGGGRGHEGKRVLVLATEQLGPHRLFGWADLVWQPGMLTTRTQVMREVREMGGIEAALSDRFASAGFTVIDPHVLRGRLQPKPAFEALDLSNGLAQQVAQKSDADFVIIAKGVAQLAHHATIAQGGMVSGQGNVVARLVRVRDGRVMASTTQHAAAVHIDADTARIQALDEAARLAGDALTGKLGTNE
jgi:hypothetical protein